MADSLLNYIFLNLYKTGIVAEWLGSGLQHHLQQFESARYLKNMLVILNEHILYIFAY